MAHDASRPELRIVAQDQLVDFNAVFAGQQRQFMLAGRQIDIAAVDPMPRLVRSVIARKGRRRAIP